MSIKERIEAITNTVYGLNCEASSVFDYACDAYNEDLATAEDALKQASKILNAVKDLDEEVGLIYEDAVNASSAAHTKRRKIDRELKKANVVALDAEALFEELRSALAIADEAESQAESAYKHMIRKEKIIKIVKSQV